jgi:hypothetical protein
VSTARPRKISQIKPIFGNLAQTSHYHVSFGALSRPLQNHLSLRGVDWAFVAENAGLLCSSASLPGSSIGTSDIVGDVSGVAEKMANSRVFTALDLTFYVDKEYKMIKFLEHWIEFIASGSGANLIDEGYFFRMKYPKDYKSDTVKILKFDRDYNNEIEYNFFKLFPTTMYSPTVAYNETQILTVTASFNYERYVCGSTRSIDISYLRSNNLIPQNVTASTSSSTSTPKNNSNRLATGREEMIWRNLNQGTGRLDDPRPRGIGGPINPSPDAKAVSNSSSPNNSSWFRTL